MDLAIFGIAALDASTVISLSLGAVVGCLLALTGAGGAILSVPLLGFGLNLTISQAGPIGLFAVCLTAGIGAMLALRDNILRWRAASFMAMFGLLLTPLGIWLAHRIPNQPLSIAFALLLVFVGGKLFVQAWRELSGHMPAATTPPPCQLNQSIGRLIWTVPCARALAYAGATAGFFSGLLGVGGGFIIVPSLKRFTDLPVRSIVATSLGVLTIVSLGNVLIATAAGTMLWAIALPFATGALGGMFVGRQIAKKMSGPRLQQFFAVFTLCIAVLMLYKALKH